MSTDVTAKLSELGFTGQEARVYVALLGRPSATGYEVAKATGLSRANVYHALSSLLENGMIEQTSGDPARYVAQPPATVLGRIKRETAERCDTLAETLTAFVPPPDPAGFWTLRGRDAVIAETSLLIGEAQERVAMCLWATDLAWARPALERAHAAGCRLVLNIFGKAELPFGDVFRHEDPSKVVSGHMVVVAVDSRVALAANLDEPSGGVYTRHLALVSLVEKLIRDEAYLAAIYDRFHDDLEAAFGPSLIELRRRLLPSDQAERLGTVASLAHADAVAALLDTL